MTNGSTQRDILGKHSRLRIDPIDIKIDTKPHAKGGQADVTTGILKGTTLGHGRVAVKKLRYDGGTDNEKFSKVCSLVYKANLSPSRRVILILPILAVFRL